MTAKPVNDLNLIMIGNCSVAALLDKNARYVWGCLPDFAGDPVFCDLLAGNEEPEAGFFDIVLDNQVGEGATRVTRESHQLFPQ